MTLTLLLLLLAACLYVAGALLAVFALSAEGTTAWETPGEKVLGTALTLFWPLVVFGACGLWLYFWVRGDVDEFD